MNRFFSKVCNRKRPVRCLTIFVLLTLLGTLAPPAPAQEDDEEEFVQQGFEVKEKSPNSGPDPYKLFLAGQEAHERGDLDKALELYSAALDELPEFPEAEYQRGTIFQARGMLDEAERSFRNAVGLKRDWTLALSSLGSVLVVNGKTREAESVLQKAIRLDPLSYNAYTSLADLYMSHPPGGDELRALYSSLVYVTSKSRIPAAVWAARASVERLLGMPGAAQESIRRSLEIEPGNIRARYERVELLLDSSDFEGASAEASALVSKHPEVIGPKLLLARGLALGGKKDKALEVLDGIRDPDALVTALADSIRASGEVDVASLEKRLKEEPENIAILEALCLELRRKKPLDALNYCRRAYEIDRGNISHAAGYAAALVQLREFGRAIGLLEEIKAREPDNYTVRANLATAYFESGRFENAKAEYRWITLERPELPAGFYFLAITHDRLQEYVDAMANYQQFLSISDAEEFENEIGRVKLRMPILQKQIKAGKGKN